MNDIPELSDEQLARMIPVSLRKRLMTGQINSGDDVSALRRFVDLSQDEFASALGISVHTLRNWEQGRRTPEGPAIGLLRIAARHPRILRENVQQRSIASKPARYVTHLADAPEESLEYKIAVVKPDHEPAIQAVIDGVNLCANAVALTNPQAGLAIKTVSVLSGWVWNRWKFDRVRPVLEAVASRIRSIESAYVRHDEFADLLEDALRRVSEQPSTERQSALRNILMRVLAEPKEHVRNRWFLRCADELDSDALFVLNLIGELAELPFRNPAMSWSKLAERTGRARTELHETVGRLAAEHVVVAEGTLGLLPPDQSPSPYRLRLTRWGVELLDYMREAPSSSKPKRR